MINEVEEVKSYLRGENITKSGLYRTVYLIAKWYLQEGFDFIETREKIFEWGKKYNAFIEYRVNWIISAASKDLTRLSNPSSVLVSQDDIDQINKTFDTKNTKLVAFALLCYAKVHANAKSEFTISLSAMAEWLHMNKGNMISRHYSEIVAFGYVAPIKKTGTRNKKVQSTRLKINASIDNNGIYELRGNDIVSFFNSIF